MSKCKMCEREAKKEGMKFCTLCSRVIQNIPAVFIDNLEPELKLDKNGSYFLHGSAGVGKSQRAANLLVTRRGGTWANVPKLLHDIRATFNAKLPPGESPVDHVTLLSETSWLCLDDLGIENTTDWVFQTLYIIINNRYESCLPTIITSNLSLPELTEKMEDDRLTSRIMGMCEVMEITGKDRRNKK